MDMSPLPHKPPFFAQEFQSPTPGSSVASKEVDMESSPPRPQLEAPRPTEYVPTASSTGAEICFCWLLIDLIAADAGSLSWSDLPLVTRDTTFPPATRTAKFPLSVSVPAAASYPTPHPCH